MKIYTKTGDAGKTSLLGGTRVPKYHLRIEAYGTVDELNAHVGAIRSQEIGEDAVEMLLTVQDKLLTIGSNLASEPRSKIKIPKLSEEDVTNLERQIDGMEEELPPMRNFVLPGGHPAVAAAHIARCVCRRAERLVLHLKEENEVADEITVYLNRLSDFLFVLSRKLTKDLNVREIPWTPNKG
ncbi:MAG TPA: cob(I)yrinic acid a,c-diamide adenosyltransferase [Cryomorphaceae bacterium]|nr:cob(I)yrinic acid a,c-diamide adenosyltransferase [Cryomorphaceae bacterium]